MRRALSIAALLAIAGCGPDTQAPGGPLVHAVSTSGRFSLDLYTVPQPPVRGKIDARLDLRLQDGSAATGLTPTITPWMPQHGHGSSVVPMVVETDGGNYDVNDLYLPMEGLWQLRTAIDGHGDDEIDAEIEVR